MAERKFRDGKREIPDYMDDLMAGLPTEKLTYQQAVDAMNRQIVAGVADRAVDRMVANHFAGVRRR